MSGTCFPSGNDKVLRSFHGCMNVNVLSHEQIFVCVLFRDGRQAPLRISCAMLPVDTLRFES